MATPKAMACPNCVTRKFGIISGTRTTARAKMPQPTAWNVRCWGEACLTVTSERAAEAVRLLIIMLIPARFSSCRTAPSGLNNRTTRMTTNAMTSE